MSYKYIAHIPLAGGFVIGTMNIIDNPPLAITSYSKFESNDSLLIKYLNKNGYNIPYYQLDKINDEEKIELSKLYKEIDFVTGIPPCNALSQAAQRKAGTRGTAAPNEWMYKSAKFVLGEIQPKCFAFENAPGLYTNSGEEVRKNLIKIGNEFGYAITFYKTNTIYHGLPQSRPRTFAIFLKGNFAPILNYYNKPYINLTEFLEQIPSSASHYNEYMNPEWDISNHEITRYLIKLYGDNWKEILVNYREHITTYDYLLRTKLFEDFIEYQKSLPDKSDTVTRNLQHIKKNSEQGRNSRINYRVLGLDKYYVYAVIGEMMGRQVHPKENRLLNIREFMSLMGLPLDYELGSSKDYVKITQNVPTTTCSDITKEIIEIINGNRKLHTQSVYMQDNTKRGENIKTKSLF